MLKTKRVYSFDIFDTCLVRSCGTAENFFDVLAYMVFDGDVEDAVRNQFIIARRRSELSLSKTDPFFDIYSIYNNLDFKHEKLKETSQLPEIEMQLEKELLQPVLKAKELIKKERSNGCSIIFISDMYLHSDFLIPILKQYGMFEDGDKVFISSEKGSVKHGGGLFRLIQKELNVPFKNWKHYGDNNDCDYVAAQELGIKAQRLVWDYQPYPLMWKENDTSLNYKYASIAAGISRALYFSEPDNCHKNFVLDFIAPFYCSYVYRVMTDAKSKGFKRLYFCARDAYYFFQIAEKLKPIFPDINIKYLYISRDALYNSDPETVFEYMKQEGLADKNTLNAIVDTTTSGKTISFLNNLFERNGVNKIYGYYTFHWNGSETSELTEGTQLHSEIQETNIYNNSKYAYLCRNFYIFENYFSMNSNKHLKCYQKNGQTIVPVFEDTSSEECYIDNIDKWSEIHSILIGKYTSEFIKTKLYTKSDELFELAIRSILLFFRFPDKEYLPAFLTFNSFFSNKPVIKESGIFHLLLYRGKDTEWPMATKILNLPKQVSFFIKNRYRRKNIF